jgi:hypothetical protein
MVQQAPVRIQSWVLINLAIKSVERLAYIIICFPFYEYTLHNGVNLYLLVFEETIGIRFEFRLSQVPG